MRQMKSLLPGTASVALNAVQGRERWKRHPARDREPAMSPSNSVKNAIYAGVVLAALPIVTAVPAKATTRGEDLAQRWCMQCHAVKPNQASLNPKAPPFPVVAAQPSISDYTLRVFLKIQHVEMPNFILNPDDADVLIGYILSLRPKR